MSPSKNSSNEILNQWGQPSDWQCEGMYSNPSWRPNGDHDQSTLAALAHFLLKHLLKQSDCLLSYRCLVPIPVSTQLAIAWWHHPSPFQLSSLSSSSSAHQGLALPLPQPQLGLSSALAQSVFSLAPELVWGSATLSSDGGFATRSGFGRGTKDSGSGGERRGKLGMEKNLRSNCDPVLFCVQVKNNKRERLKVITH